MFRKKKKDLFLDFLRCSKANIVNSLRSMQVFMNTGDINISLAPTNRVMNSINIIKIYMNIMKDKGGKIAVLCDTDESKYIIEQGMLWKLIPLEILVVYKNIDPPLKSKNNMNYASEWTKQVQGIVVPRIFFNDDHSLYEVYSDIKMRGDKVAIADLGGSWLSETEKLYKFRELVFSLGKESVIPRYLSNSPYIDYLLNQISHRKSIKVMDICSGQGSIGFSLFKESNNVNFVLNVEINENQVKAMNTTIEKNDLDHAKVQTCLSDGLTNVPRDIKFDLITGNPPHQNRKRRQLISSYREPDSVTIQGGDEDWSFHKNFFKSADQFLTDHGVICLLENGSPAHSDVNLFKEMVERANPNLILYDSINLPGARFYLILIGKKGISKRLFD